mgnify:CR=1 FL=1
MGLAQQRRTRGESCATCTCQDNGICTCHTEHTPVSSSEEQEQQQQQAVEVLVMAWPSAAEGFWPPKALDSRQTTAASSSEAELLVEAVAVAAEVVAAEAEAAELMAAELMVAELMVAESATAELAAAELVAAEVVEAGLMA